MFDFLKSKPKMDFYLNIKAPRSFESTAYKLGVIIAMSAKTAQKVDKLAVRLRADSTKSRNVPGSKAYQYLGEAIQPAALLIEPNKPLELNCEIPLDFGPIDSFEIPPENLAVASPEMKAAAAANRTMNYRYSVEAIYKLEGSAEQVISQPIKLTQPDEVRIG